MTPDPARFLPSVRAVGALALALTLTATSCGRRLPMTPASDSHLAHGTRAPEALESDNAEDEVMVTLEAGVDPAGFGNDYGATLVGSSGSGASTFQPAAGELPDDLATR